jgi:hypothetical protein
MNHARLNNQFITNAGLIFLAWTFYGLFFASQSYLRTSYYGYPAEWQNILVVWLICAYAWALLTPPVLWLYRRVPFENKIRFRFLYVHIAGAVFFSLIHLALYTTIRPLLLPSLGDWLTNFQHIVVEEFHVDVLIYFSILAINYAFDYIFKPREAEISRVDAHEFTRENSVTEKPAFPERLTVKENGRIILVEVSQIDCVTSEGNYVKLHTKSKAYLLRETMNGMEQKLGLDNFVRLRRSTIVRIEQIREFRPLFNGEFEVVLKSGAKHISSRRYRKNLESILGS